jgi:GDP-L-fucose synthase
MIRDIADTIAKVVGYEGRIYYNTTKADWMARNLIDSSKLMSLVWQSAISLRESLTRAYKDFAINQA